jgi:hypothetical protein
MFTDERSHIRLQKPEGASDFYEGQFALRFPIMDRADAGTRLVSDITVAKQRVVRLWQRSKRRKTEIEEETGAKRLRHGPYVFSFVASIAFIYCSIELKKICIALQSLALFLLKKN